jgi:hypothetical protein
VIGNTNLSVSDSTGEWMKTRLLLAWLVPATLVAMPSLADDKAACLDAASKGQRFKDNHKLVEAREQFRVCAAVACPAVVQSDCATWLAEVEAALPSVVVTAKNAAGADLVEVKVSMDGQPLVSRLDGHAVPMNAGPHTFRLTSADGTTLEKQVVVREGEKNQSVAVVLGPAGAPVAASSPPSGRAAPPTSEAPGAVTPSPPSPAVLAAPAEAHEPSSALKSVGWVLGMGGVVGLGVGTVAGVVAILDKNSAHCVNNVCDPGTTSGIKSAALVSDIGWIAGGVLLASGAAFVLFAPRGSHEPAAGVRVAPVVTARSGAIVAGASW